MNDAGGTSRWRTLDLFCGAAGGWSLGLHRAGFKTVAACEVDPWRRAVFGRNNPGVVLYDDVRTLNAARLIRDLGFLPDIVCGSPPCQDASAANTKGRGVDGERTGLFFDAVRIVREVRPRWVLLENVPGLRTRGYDRVHDELEAAGYAVWPFVVGAVHAGAPHLRKRVWIVALAKSAQEQMGRAGFAWAEAERVSANPDRDGVRQQPRRGDGADGRVPTITKVDAAVAAPMHGASLARGEPDGNRTEAVADAAGCARRAGLREGGSVNDRPFAANGGGETAPDAHEAGLEERGGAEPDGAEHAAAIDLLSAFRDWNGGPPDLGRVDDGVSEALASIRVRGDGRQPDERHGRPSRKLKTTGVGRNILAAYGDAVVPQITEAIGRAVRLIDKPARSA